jgi:hypothetical protein
MSQAGYMDLANYSFPQANIYVPTEFFGEQGWGRVTCPSTSFGEFMEAHDIAGGAKTSRFLGTVAPYEDMLTLYTYSSNDKGMYKELEQCEGYFRIKLMSRTENVMGDASSFAYRYMHNNVCYMRYAEVLLNYAEAVAMGGADGSSLSGLQALNLVRKRAGLSDAPALDMNNAAYGIKAERRAELHWEGSRFIDLVRWGDAPALLADAGKMMPYFHGYKNGKNSTVQSKAEWYVDYRPQLGEGFKAGKHELLPIPLSEINSNPALQQNSGW